MMMIECRLERKLSRIVLADDEVGVRCDGFVVREGIQISRTQTVDSARRP